jgi:hypothetical protein
MSSLSKIFLLLIPDLLCELYKVPPLICGSTQRKLRGTMQATTSTDSSLAAFGVVYLNKHGNIFRVRTVFAIDPWEACAEAHRSRAYDFQIVEDPDVVAQGLVAIARAGADLVQSIRPGCNQVLLEPSCFPRRLKCYPE